MRALATNPTDLQRVEQRVEQRDGMRFQALDGVALITATTHPGPSGPLTALGGLLPAQGNLLPPTTALVRLLGERARLLLARQQTEIGGCRLSQGQPTWRRSNPAGGFISIKVVGVCFVSPGWQMEWESKHILLWPRQPLVVSRLCAVSQLVTQRPC